MNKGYRPLSSRHESSLPKWLGTRPGYQDRTVIRVLFRVSCLSLVAWLVWNHALTDFLNAGGIGVWQSIGIGAILHGLSKVLEDTDSQWDGDTSTRVSR